MPGTTQLLLAFPDATVGQANAHVGILQDCIEAAAADVGVLGRVTFDSVRASKDAQDFGSMLTLAVAGPAAAAIASGIKTFIAKRGSRVRIYDSNGNVLVEADGSAADNINVAKAIEAYENRPS